ncbi:MAG: electron-transfer flavoprotein:ubiquinone oxidoreductase [Gammaproteobacteria bacterium]|nr:electron-transfer flavoprotein:ubiquinone oxidoreductase [Gammaproteobacteria bacterium]
MAQPPASVRPAAWQRALPVDRFIVEESPGAEALPLDVVFVGGGPAGLAGAIQLAKLARADGEEGGDLRELEIGVLEKAGELGEHCLSGAVVNPRAFRELFPELSDGDFPFARPVSREAVYLLTGARAIRLPTPPTMRNHGNFVGSICEMVRWLGERAEELGVNVFPGFPVDSLLVEGTRVAGVRTTPAGLDRKGAPGAGYQPPMDISATVTVLAEGTRGPLTQAWLEREGIGSPNPQIYALGVKELWRTRRPLDRVVHTLGWPLPRDAFGGSFMYPLADDLVALGLVVGLDYRDASLDVHELLQQMKLHPLFRPTLEGGEMLEWGAKTIPEGGYYSIPERRHGEGVVVCGDAAGLVDVPSLKGIHYAMQSGIHAARAIFAELKGEGDGLAGFSRALDDSYVMKDLRRTRNLRLAFKKGFWAGGIRAGLMTATGGAFPGARIPVAEDVEEERRRGSAPAFKPDGELTFSKVDAVYKSGNQTRDDIPSHVLAGDAVPPEGAAFYARMCPAGVYEEGEDGDLVINAPNCVDCKATDVLGPRWTPREGGSGPAYRRM